MAGAQFRRGQIGVRMSRSGHSLGVGTNETMVKEDHDGAEEG